MKKSGTAHPHIPFDISSFNNSQMYIPPRLRRQAGCVAVNKHNQQRRREPQGGNHVRCSFVHLFVI